MKRILFFIVLYVPPWMIVFFAILTFAMEFFFAPWIAAEKLLHSKNFKNIDGLECVELAQEKTKVSLECRCNLPFHRLKFVFNSKNPPGEIERLSDFKMEISYNLLFITCDLMVRLILCIFFWIGWRFLLKGWNRYQNVWN